MLKCLCFEQLVFFVLQSEPFSSKISFVESVCIYSHSMAARDIAFPRLDVQCRVRGLAVTSVCEVQSIF